LLHFFYKAGTAIALKLFQIAYAAGNLDAGFRISQINLKGLDLFTPSTSSQIRPFFLLPLFFSFFFFG